MVTMEHKNLNPQLSRARLTTLNINKFKMIEVMGLKILHQGPLEYHYVLTKFH
jgi:hypothetical protein